MQPQDALKRLERIEKELEEIRGFLEDTFLEADDRKAIEQARREEAAGELVTHEELKKELGL